ncbi:hypothetical protein [Streptomyces sp. NPDC020983]|uniref:hypothetical protein n=1 Tax=Streptomyces sp. NPDC020983 TaxID=3365106 RepID=UPI00378A00C2
MLLEISKEQIEGTVRASSCEAMKMIPPAVLEAVLEGLEQTIALGMGPAANLVPTYRGRYDAIKEFRENRFGWNGFFQALDESSGSVGMHAVRGGEWRMLLLLNESCDSVIASLVRPPGLEDWPEGASVT